jgi:Rrf2 family protein
VRASAQLRYAIYGVFDLAFNGGERTVALQEVGARQAIPARYLEQIFQKLRRAGIVRAKRGPGGGYQLARSADGITLADLVVAIQGRPLRLSEGDDSSPSSPEFLWAQLESALEGVLSQRSIGDLCREAIARGMKREGGEPAMYDI